MKILTEQHPDTDNTSLSGADMVDYLPKWYRIDELVDMVRFGPGVQRPTLQGKGLLIQSSGWMYPTHGYLIQHGA